MFYFNTALKPEKAPLGTSLRVDAVHADLLSLEDPDFKDKIDVRCCKCSAKVKFTKDHIDPFRSMYVCPSWGCLGVLAFSVHKATPAQVKTLYFVSLVQPEEALYKIQVEYHVGQQAFGYLREASEDEKWAEAVKRLKLLRQKVLDSRK